MPRGPQATRLETPFPCASNASLRCAPCTCSARMGGQRAAAECNSPCSPVRQHRRPDRTRAERRARHRVNPSANNDLDDTSSLLQSRRGSHFRPLLLSSMTRPKEQCGGTPQPPPSWLLVRRRGDSCAGATFRTRGGRASRLGRRAAPRAPGAVRDPATLADEPAVGERGEAEPSNCSRASCQLGGFVRRASGRESPVRALACAWRRTQDRPARSNASPASRLARELLLQRCDVEPRALPADQPLREVEHVQQPDLHLLAVAC